MEVIKTEIEGVVIIEPRLFKDERGYFFESFSEREFNTKVRTIRFVQDNESKSRSCRAYRRQPPPVLHPSRIRPRIQRAHPRSHLPIQMR